MLKKIIFFIFILISTQSFSQKKWGFKVGVVTPIPFFIETPYIVHPSSALAQVSYELSEKFKLNSTTGYLRFRANEPEYDIVSSVPLMVGGTYDLSNSFYVGMSLGPSYIAESENIVEGIKLLYSPYLGFQSGHWSVDLTYFNWEEVPEELNSLTICVSYNF